MKKVEASKKSEQLPAIPAEPPRIIKGAHLKFTVDGVWTEDGVPVPASARYVVLGIEKIYQKWTDGLVRDVKREPLGDLEKLNSSVPIKEWETDLNGKPRPPWQQCYVLDLISPVGVCSTYPGSSIGAGIAVRALRESINGMERIRGGSITPIVELSSRPMKTRYSSTPRPRPHFIITGWQVLGGGGEPLLAPGGGNGPQLGGAAAVDSKTLDDEVPWLG
jgi:hypothetical protein